MIDVHIFVDCFEWTLIPFTLAFDSFSQSLVGMLSTVEDKYVYLNRKNFLSIFKIRLELTMNGIELTYSKVFKGFSSSLRLHSKSSFSSSESISYISLL